MSIDACVYVRYAVLELDYALHHTVIKHIFLFFGFLLYLNGVQQCLLYLVLLAERIILAIRAQACPASFQIRFTRMGTRLNIS